MFLLAAFVPTFSAPAGFFDADFPLQITAADPADTVLYGLGGAAATLPLPSALSITGTTVVTALSVGSDGVSSPSVTRTFLKLEDVLAPLDPLILGDPAYSLAVEDTLLSLPTLAVTTGGPISTVEQAASLEWIDPAGPTFQVSCGAALSGTTSLGYAKNSVRIYFREVYGLGRLQFDLFPPDQPGPQASTEQDALSLRSGHDSVFWLAAQGQYTRNFWMDESLLAMGHTAPHGTYAHLYENGEYVGLYHVRERWGAAMMSLYGGGAEGAYEAVNGGTLYDGTGAAWGQVLAHAGDWEGLAPWLDRAAFLDYMLLEFYAANSWDWSAWHNWAAAGPSAPGQGGLQFVASDADVALVYDENTDITGNAGPANLFGSLLQEGDPDFFVAWMDRIHRSLEGGGPLTVGKAAARYARISGLIEDAVVAESARWGAGWWDRDEEWVTERARLLDTFFPARTAVLLNQLRSHGWYPLPAPTIDLPSGLVPEGTVVQISSPLGASAELWLTTDGNDPRDPGGAIHTGAQGPSATWSLALAWSTRVRARLRQGGQWGPIEEAIWEVLTPTPIVLNEWNTVDPEGWLDDAADGDGGDAAWGRVQGNGGDWIELLVTEDVDLRGWALTMADQGGERGRIEFADDPLLGDLRAGTILTVAEDLPEDASYDPEGGDWRLHLRAAVDGTGRYVSATAWDVTELGWTLAFSDASGNRRFGPVGEGVAPAAGLGGDEVGALRTTPDIDLRRDDGDYEAAEQSTFGAENRWEGGGQDLTLLRGLGGGVIDVDDPELPTPEATPEPEIEDEPTRTRGCQQAGDGRGLGLIVLLLIARRRPRS